MSLKNIRHIIKYDVKYKVNKHSGPLFQKSNFSPPPPGDDKFFELLHYTPKTFHLYLGVAGKTNTDFVRFVTILPIFAAKRPDYNSCSI